MHIATAKKYLKFYFDEGNISLNFEYINMSVEGLGTY